MAVCENVNKEIHLTNHHPMTARSYLESKHGVHCHTLPLVSIIELMEGYARHRHEEFKKAKQTFSTEKWIAEETIRRHFPKQDKK